MQNLRKTFRRNHIDKDSFNDNKFFRVQQHRDACTLHCLEGWTERGGHEERRGRGFEREGAFG